MRVADTKRRHQVQGRGARSSRLLGVLPLVGALLLASCSGGSSDDGSHGPSARSLKKIGAVVERAKVLHWSGSWRQDNWDPGAPPMDVTADLRVMGRGDVFGTMTADGRDAQVMLVSGTRLFAKADRVTLEAMGAGNPEAQAGRWTEMREPDKTRALLGLRLDWLAPSVLGSKLASSAVNGTGQDADGGSASPDPELFPRPSGVAADAAPVAITGDESTGAGTYWVSAGAPHRLLGYSGLDVRHDRDVDSFTMMSHSLVARLSVRSEGAPAARGAYAAMRSAIRSLPPTVPVSITPTHEQVSESTDEECGVLCHTVTVSVTLTNRLPQESVTAHYDLNLTAANRMDGDHLRLSPYVYEDLGSCAVRLPAARPGATVRGACTVDGAALRKAVGEATDEHGFMYLDFETEVTPWIDITGPSHTEDLLKRLGSQADDVLGTG